MTEVINISSHTLYNLFSCISELDLRYYYKSILYLSFLWLFLFCCVSCFLYQKENKTSIFRRHVMTGAGGEGRRLLRIPQCLSFLASSTVYKSVFVLPSLVWMVSAAKSCFIFIVLALDGHFLLIVLYFLWANTLKACSMTDVTVLMDALVVP